MEALREGLAQGDGGVTGSSSRRHAVLTVGAERRHFWSPHLGLTIKEEEEGGTQLFGRFSPHPHIWTGFMFVYGMLFMFGLSGAMYGLAQLSLGSRPWALFIPLVTAALAAFVYGAAFIGQGLGADEMYELRSFLDDAVEAAIEKGRITPRTPLDSARL